MAKSEIAIVGSGIAGIAIARGLNELDPTLNITVYEREPHFGIHASARNSGVLHAGFYYSPESMKARFCREGRDELEGIATRFQIPIRKVGKVVVAQNENEESRLDLLLERGISNGVNLIRLPENELPNYEPLAQTFGSFLWSPETSISNPIEINSAIREELISRRVNFISSSNVTINNGKWFSNGEEIKARYFINAAGAWALDLAQELNLGMHLRTMPFLGLYNQTKFENLPIRKLVYPVPHPINPFLGVHFTITMDGFVKIGPSALPIVGRDQYSLTSIPTIREILDFGRNLKSISKGSKHDLLAMMQYEIPKILTSNLVNSASALVPQAKTTKSWTRKAPGIRGQLIDNRNGELIQDFLLETSENSIHILNAVSPGWTASIPFGRHVAQLALERFNRI